MKTVLIAITTAATLLSAPTLYAQATDASKGQQTAEQAKVDAEKRKAELEATRAKMQAEHAARKAERKAELEKLKSERDAAKAKDGEQGKDSKAQKGKKKDDT